MRLNCRGGGGGGGDGIEIADPLNLCSICIRGSFSNLLFTAIFFTKRPRFERDTGYN
jgi:hypothetical protein